MTKSGDFSRTDINHRMLEFYPGRDLSAILAKKLFRNKIIRMRKLLGFKPAPETGFERAVSYNGLVVFDSHDLDG